MFFHALWNFIFAILLPIFYYQFATPYAENTDAYEISITEKPFFVSDESQYLKIDSNKMDKSIRKMPNTINFQFPTVETVGYGNAIPTNILGV
jgi:hypothetical protein